MRDFTNWRWCAACWSSSQALIDQRYVVDVVNDGEAAWQQANVLAYDLILLDMMLPKLDGVSLCQRLRSKGCGIPILMLTAATLPLTVTGLDAGADDYLVKPIELQNYLLGLEPCCVRNHTPILSGGGILTQVPMKSPENQPHLTLKGIICWSFCSAVITCTESQCHHRTSLVSCRSSGRGYCQGSYQACVRKLRQWEVLMIWLRRFMVWVITSNYFLSQCWPKREEGGASGKTSPVCVLLCPFTCLPPVVKS